MRSGDNRSQTLKGLGVPALDLRYFPTGSGDLYHQRSTLERASGYNQGEEWGTRCEEIN